MRVLDCQPVLEDAQLAMRPLRPADRAALHAVASDPLIWEQHPAHDRWRAEVFARFFDDALASQGALVAIDKASGQIIGSSRYDGLEEANGGSVEIGWTFLARKFWGGTANRAMKRLMVGHALGAIGECRFVVGEENWRSRRALEKIGARLTARSEERGMAGAMVRHLVYAMTREEFAAGPLARP
ncbi:GNAT family N-acetyltransferase [Qipengyuania nanhaisediminis]|uniref:GNAT family N-acetyltransferase n=1 Tax=Qipengyuania nanhaisediminis TaxID=604088 RepID=UPI0038B28C30